MRMLTEVSPQLKYAVDCFRWGGSHIRRILASKVCAFSHLYLFAAKADTEPKRNLRPLNPAPQGATNAFPSLEVRLTFVNVPCHQAASLSPWRPR